MEEIEIRYKTNFFSKEKRIVFSENSLKLYSEEKLLIEIDKDEIRDCRFGISWIHGIDFTIGRVYCIDIGNINSNKVIKIRLRSLYGVNKKVLWEKYNHLIDKIYDYYLNEGISNYIANINNGIDVEVGSVTFKREGVYLGPPKEDSLIEWEDLNSIAYTYYYTLSSKKKPEFYKAFTYLKDWNAVIVYSVSRQILKDKGLYIES